MEITYGFKTKSYEATFRSGSLLDRILGYRTLPKPSFNYLSSVPDALASDVCIRFSVSTLSILITSTTTPRAHISGRAT